MSGAEHVPTGIEAAICADIARRQAFGIAKYGQTVADNPLTLRAWLQHGYEEALDLAIYLKRAMAELDVQARAQLPSLDAALATNAVDVLVGGQKLAAAARAAGFVVTIENAPLQPLAMGHHEPVVDVREVR